MWIYITVIATILQIARTSEQHRLKTVLNSTEAGYVRFVYAFPIALLLGSAWMAGPGELPATDTQFWLSAAVASVSQITATIALLKSFRIRNFAVGTMYAKTEILFVGLASTIFLGEAVKLLAWAGGMICLTGVTILLIKSTPLVRFDSAALYGLFAGAGFALTSVALRGASASLTGTIFDRATVTLTAILGIQTCIQGIYISCSSKTSLVKVAQAWRQALGVAVLSLTGSTAWALAMTLENAAKVRTLGQLEIILAFAFGVAFHREKHSRIEYAASTIALAGIILYVAA